MKLHFVFSPPVVRQKNSSLPEHVYPPLGILYLAGYIRAFLPELELRATDGLLLGLEGTFQEVAAGSPDMVFISFITPCAQGAYELARRLKATPRPPLIVMGGPHATALPAEPFEKSPCDMVVFGEGERTALELVRAVLEQRPLAQVDGLCWRDGGRVVTNQPREFIKDLDEIPFPARDLLSAAEYRGWFVTKKTPETIILSSRGCPFDCTFCSNIIWKSSKPWLRLRSPGNIVDEIEHLAKDQGIQEFFDNGDEFNNNIAHATAVCNELIRRNLGVTWKAQLRAHPLPESLVKLMAEAGCWYVHLGIESGNQRTLDGIRKHITLAQVEQACELLKKYGIKVFGLFMLYNVWEEDGRLQYEDTRDTLNTLAFAKRMVDRGLLAYVSSTIATPYPGSKLYEIAVRHNLFNPGLSHDWEQWLTNSDFIMKLPGVTDKEAGGVYFRASLLRAYCFLKSGNWKLKDVPLLADKGLHAIRLKIKTLLRPGTA